MGVEQELGGLIADRLRVIKEIDPQGSLPGNVILHFRNILYPQYGEEVDHVIDAWKSSGYLVETLGLGHIDLTPAGETFFLGRF